MSVVLRLGHRRNVDTESIVEPVFTKDGDVYKATVTFSENADYKATVEFNENADYTFDIKYTDKSHNVFDSYETNEFTIDKTAPVVDVTFSEPELVVAKKKKKQA